MFCLHITELDRVSIELVQPGTASNLEVFKHVPNLGATNLNHIPNPIPYLSLGNGTYLLVPADGEYRIKINDRSAKFRINEVGTIKDPNSFY